MYSQELLSGITPSDIERILAVEHSDPHAVLGAHSAHIRGEHGIIVRAFHPDATKAELLIDDERIAMKDSNAAGLFSYFLPGRQFPLSYRTCFHFRDGTTWEADTPYRFAPVLGE
ncbi:MAG: GlgB N-terminal domain-containing protein, partial [Syntrophales bacterium]